MESIGGAAMVQRPAAPIGRRANQVAAAEAAKRIIGVAADGGCFVATGVLKGAAAGACAGVPAMVPIAEYAIDTCADATKGRMKAAAEAIVDSHHCYGDEDSCVSRTTELVRGHLPASYK